MTGQELIDTTKLSALGHGYLRCRDARWANPEAYLRLSVLLLLADGKASRSLGPWAHLFDRRSQEAIGEPTPQRILTLSALFDRDAFLAGDYDSWTGALDRADV